MTKSVDSVLSELVMDQRHPYKYIPSPNPQTRIQQADE